MYLIRLELVPLSADVARVARLLGEPHELLQQRLLGLHLTPLVGLQPDGLQLLRPHRHRQLLLLGFGLLPGLLYLNEKDVHSNTVSSRFTSLVQLNSTKIWVH